MLPAFLAHLRAAPPGAPLALLAIDPGLRRCGYALCRDARALPPPAPRAPPPAVQALGWATARAPPAPAAPLERALALHTAVACRLAALHGVRGVVVGHPLDPLGARAGSACALAEALAARLQAALGSGAAVLLWDERGSSVRARQGLRAARLALRGGAHPTAALPRALGGQVDQAAAAEILASFLSAHPLL
jgi:RNase H-fold protein (predicted Holliday junction resolvase)